MIKIVTYPVLAVLTLIFVGPTIPIDLSIIIITSIVAAIGLSASSDGFALRAHLAAWRAAIFALWKPGRSQP